MNFDEILKIRQFKWNIISVYQQKRHVRKKFTPSLAKLSMDGE
jgi:hypothetical protein